MTPKGLLATGVLVSLASCVLSVLEGSPSIFNVLIFIGGAFVGKSYGVWEERQ